MLGVFDSGVGGLTVVKELRRIMPTASITYVGDTARAPYGGKDAETLISHGREIIRFLLKKGATAIVMACGTSSSVSLEPLRKEFPDLPIIDTIRPAVRATLLLAKQSQDFRPVFIATEATVKSGLFEKLYAEEISKITTANGFERMQKASSYSSGFAAPPARACPMFAPMVEAGLAGNHPLLNFAAENYLADLRGKVNALILGCTHYPLLTGALTHVLGEITFINPATKAAEAARDKYATANENPKIEYYASGDTKKFAKAARLILEEKCRAKKVSL